VVVSKASMHSVSLMLFPVPLIPSHVPVVAVPSLRDIKVAAWADGIPDVVLMAGAV